MRRKLATRWERQKALALMQEMRRLSVLGASPLKGMTKTEAIRHMRETRERLWEEKIAALGSRR